MRAHDVVAGDTLYDIGRRYGVAVADLRRVNRLESNIIHPGQRLIIPVGGGSGQVGRGGASRQAVDLLARLIQAEAASEPYQAKVAVGAVVLNRVQSKLFPNSIAGVINQVTQKGTYQFTPVLNGSINRPAGAESLRAARDAINGLDPTGGALFFFTNGAGDNYLRSRPVSMVVGKLTFTF